MEKDTSGGKSGVGQKKARKVVLQAFALDSPPLCPVPVAQRQGESQELSPGCLGFLGSRTGEERWQGRVSGCLGFSPHPQAG